VFNADSQRNTVFSIHMYGVYSQASTITSYLNTFVSAKLPILVGEFGNQHSDGDVDEDTIMATAQSQRLGYMGWSWSGNGSPVQYLDMTNNFNPASLTTWGNRIINGANGIKATSREASIFSGATPPVTTPPRTTPPATTPPGTTPPATTAPPVTTPPAGGGSCAVTYKADSWGTGFVANVTVTNRAATPLNGWTLRWSFAGNQQVTSAWNATVTQSGQQVTAASAGWNGSVPANGSASFGFQATYSGSNAAPAAFTLNGTACANA
jgi:mannan endo-1,4-beta-mannosidase